MARAGIVLSGGGARGAYEAGVAAGIVEVLGLRAGDTSPFHVLVGTSVGAINVTYLASQAHRGDLGVDRLCRLWRRLELVEHLDADLKGMMRLVRPIMQRVPTATRHLGGSILDPSHLETLIGSSVEWSRLHANVTDGIIDALVVTALRIADGRTTMFAELTPGTEFVPSSDPYRHAVRERITHHHVLASAAIPLLFPARRIGKSFYCDGGLRFNTPLAPAIRAGAERIVVVSLRHPPDRPINHTHDYPSPIFLVGKLLDALLLDPIRYDLQILERFNRLAHVLDDCLTEEERVTVDDVLIESRGLPYRPIETLVFEPSADIGRLAGQHAERALAQDDLPARTRWLLQLVTQTQFGTEADLASYILFDGRFADEILELGRRDVRARADDVKRFFDA